ncbi:hypothetical protein N0Y54_33150, partial [Nostoc punctiforme UO1]|uniref:hypothetical protein n=1 Tax=Nostoc punctiforme TaxID=272131 RepID=UPI00309B60C1
MSASPSTAWDFFFSIGLGGGLRRSTLCFLDERCTLGLSFFAASWTVALSSLALFCHSRSSIIRY